MQQIIDIVTTIPGSVTFQTKFTFSLNSCCDISVESLNTVVVVLFAKCCFSVPLLKKS